MADLSDADYYKNPNKFIEMIVESRILGTGVHMTNPKKGLVYISYRNIRIWGIKKPLTQLVDLITKSINEKFPESGDITDEEFEKLLFDIAPKFLINRTILNDKFFNVREPHSNWDFLDEDLKIAILINAFIDAFDETEIKLIETRQHKDWRLINILQRKEKNRAKIEYRLENFGFVFRARIYCYLISNKYFNDSFEKVIARIDEQLELLYREYFVKSRLPSAHMQKELTSKQSYDERIARKRLRARYLKRLALELDSNDKERILNAIDIIERRKIRVMKERLEYFFNAEDEDIINKAFDAYMSLRKEERD